MLPKIPELTVPGGLPSFMSHEPGLAVAFVSKLPFLNCSTTVKVPSGLCLTVKCRSNVSFAQSFMPQVPESVESLG
jgi:hypothetical protein